jgi:hypothetical protein
MSSLLIFFPTLSSNSVSPAHIYLSFLLFSSRNIDKLIRDLMRSRLLLVPPSHLSDLVDTYKSYAVCYS